MTIELVDDLKGAQLIVLGVEDPDHAMTFYRLLGDARDVGH